MGTITDNHLSEEELVEETFEEMPEEDSGPGNDTLDNLLRESEQLVSEDDTLEVELGTDTVNDTEQNDAVEEETPWVPRRSERIANRTGDKRVFKMARGDAALERKVHVFRVKAMKAFGSDHKTAARVIRIMRLTIKKAMAKDPGATVASVQKEFRQLIDKDVWTVLRKANLTTSQLKSAIRSSLFLKEKFDAAGIFD
jgi:hypothetical protein